MEVLNDAPDTGSFIALAEHQSTTPASFHSGPPVLHYYSDRCKVIVLEHELQSAPALANFVSKATSRAHSNEREQQEAEEEANGTDSAQKTIEEVDVWVTSDKLLLFSKPYETGVAIPYPTISLHAIQSLPAPASTEPQSQGLYMQLIPSLPNPNDEEPPDTVSVTIVPTAAAPPPPTAPMASEDDAIESEDQPQQTPVQAFFTALSDCSNLHPDPEEEGEEHEQVSRLMQAGLAMPGTSDGSLPPPMPGSGGWITAENMHEFIDEDGNFVQDEGEAEAEVDMGDLGPGAGTIRCHPGDEKDGSAGSEAKWQRTS